MNVRFLLDRKMINDYRCKHGLLDDREACKWFRCSPKALEKISVTKKYVTYMTASIVAQTVESFLSEIVLGVRFKDEDSTIAYEIGETWEDGLVVCRCFEEGELPFLHFEEDMAAAKAWLNKYFLIALREA